MRKLMILGILWMIWGTAGFAQDQPKMGGTLIWGRSTDPVFLDPAKTSDSEEARVTANIFEGLVRYQDGSEDIEPALAVSWETSKDEKEWIFHLRKDVTFHDETPFNAEAVVFSFLRQIDSKHPFHREGFKFANAVFKYVKTVEAIDEYTVKITLEKPYAPFLYNLRMRHAAPIVSPSAVKKLGDQFEKHPVGTGPFRFAEWIPEDRIILEKNPTYWGNSPYLDRIVFKTIADNKTRLLELQTGAIHGMEGIEPDAVEEIKNNKELRFEIKPDLNVGYLAFNTEKKPFDQVKVRQAINYAINKHNLIKLLYQDMAIPAKNPIPPILWGYNDEIADYEYQPEKARQLLKEAGCGAGFDTTLWAMPVSRPYMPQPEKIARAIKSNLAAIGVRAEIITHDWKNYLKKIANGEHDMCLIGWISDNGDPDNFLYVLLDKDNAVKPKAQNVAFFKDDRLHDILIHAQQISNLEERIRLYRSAQEIIHEKAPWVPLAHAQRPGVFRNNVHNVIRFIQFEKAWVE
ncbi:MAG: ABC transporter substrate-binding protein [Deltaproteobacteria bacterium]|nr:ABC transporter substrate-binding protein [Deltaproteobacteria bacterium]